MNSKNFKGKNEEFYSEASILDKVKLFAYILKLNLLKQKRDYSLINKQYNSGRWNRKLEDIDFESLIGNYERNDLDNFNIVAFNDKLVKAIERDFEKKYTSQMLEILLEFKSDTVVELGCGLGGNLFMLQKNGFRNLEGYDLSENAIKNLQQYSKIKKYDIIFKQCDLNNKMISEYIENKIVFTHTCLEQCKHIMPNVIKNIVYGKPKLVINLEVDYDSSAFIVKKYVDACDYQNNLVRELKKLEHKQMLEIISIKKLSYQNHPLNRISSIIWKPL
jgi:SAM-dependent methyltransferase